MGNCMEEEDCCSCCCCFRREEGLHPQNTLIQLLPQKKTRRHLMAQVLAVALLLLFSVALVLLITVVLGGRGRHGQSPDSQLMMQPQSHSSGVSVKLQQQKDFKNPSAMLTAPSGNTADGMYLQWERNLGNAFCRGGFDYSMGNLVVPTDGIYRVFLQITYESNNDFKCDPSGDDDELRLINTVFIFQDTYKDNVAILSSVETVSSGMKQWSKSLYTAGLFSLEANCSLRVTSSCPKLIVEKEDQVFFGAELLPQ